VRASAAVVLVSLIVLWAPSLEAQEGTSSPARADGGESGVRAPEYRQWQRLFLEVGYSLTLGSAHPGMRAASLPGLLVPGQDPQEDGLPYNDAFIAPGTHGCEAPEGEYCVRVNEAGLVFAHGVHLGFGVFLTERFALSARMRYAPMAGDGPLAHFQLGLRAHLRLTEARMRGFFATVFLGGMGGQIQLRPEQRPHPRAQTIDRPYVRTGLGGLELGSKLGYRFHPSVGVFASPEVYVLFPSVSAGVQLTIGLDFAFAPTSNIPPPQEVSDRDGDGIPDEDDACPDEPETLNGFEDEDGCPDELPESQDEEDSVDETEGAQLRDEPEPKPLPPVSGVERDELGRPRFTEALKFRRNSPRIDPGSYRAADELARTIREHPEIERLVIEGHADETGSPEYNQRLSERRAESVRRALIARGVDSARLRVIGHGDRRPIHPNATSDREHAENRRVELIIEVYGGESID